MQSGWGKHDYILLLINLYNETIKQRMRGSEIKRHKTNAEYRKDLRRSFGGSEEQTGMGRYSIDAVISIQILV